MRTVADLLERVERATRSDWRIDLDLACEVGPFVRRTYLSDDNTPMVAFFERDKPMKGQWAFACGRDDPETEWHFLSTPRYTASIDAAVTLVEKVLPGWISTIYFKAATHGPRTVLLGPDYRNQIGGDAATPALSVIAALLKALSASPVHPQGS